MQPTINVLAFFAHPDDETMLCGGILALLARQGASVHVLIATRGEGGEAGEPPLCGREELGSVREAELRCAVQALGASSLTLMDYVDPLIGPDDTLFAFTENVDELAGQLVTFMREWNINALITHGVNGEYGHPAHKVAHQAAVLAIQQSGESRPLFYTVQGAFEGHPMLRLANVDAPAHLVIDVQPVLDQKTQAALCHKTQNALFIRRPSEEAGRILTVPEVIQPLESLHRVWPEVSDPGEIHDPLADRLWATGCARLAAKL